GDKARAIGRLLLGSASALPSGLVVQAAVSEQFDLTDQSRIVPPAFSEDIVLYSRGRPSGNGVLGASFPITPSRTFTIQDLLRGVVSLDVTPPPAERATAVIGAAGGIVTDTVGDTLEIAAGALAGDTV